MTSPLTTDSNLQKHTEPSNNSNKHNNAQVYPNPDSNDENMLNNQKKTIVFAVNYPVNYQQPSIPYQPNPIPYQQNQILYQKNPISYQQPPIKYKKNMQNLQINYPTNPTNYQQNPIVFNQSPANYEQPPADQQNNNDQYYASQQLLNSYRKNEETMNKN